MAKNRRRSSMKSNKTRSSRRTGRHAGRFSRDSQLTPRDLNFEPLEERMLLSINSGDPTEGEIPGSLYTAWLPVGVTREDVASQFTATNLKATVPSFVSGDLTSLINILETEQNGRVVDANLIPLGFEAGEDVAIDINGSLAPGDTDFFQIALEPGDIFGVNVSGAGNQLGFRRIDVDDEDFDGDDEEEIFLMGSGQDATNAHPTSSPLPGGGNAAMSWVVDTEGDYYIDVSGGVGSYSLNLRVFRPILESEAVGDGQILFLDFDGETIDTSIFGVGGEDTTVTLSPLSSFLTNWGLTADDEDAVIDAIVASVTESISTDIRALGNNGNFDATGNPGDFDIEILNSRDDVDPFGQKNVSRVIVGGSIAEFGIGTIGIAQSIDVGNFDTQESAVTLLDLLSAPATDPNSLNQYQLGLNTSIIELIGVGVGNITAHETGHFFAAWHTDQFNLQPNIMDQGGNLDNTIGLVGDVWGDGDENDVDFGDDTFVPNEGFTGTEDTLNAIAFGLSTGVFADTTGPQLISISPNNGEVLVDGEIRRIGPQELTFRFNDGEIIDPATLAGIQIVRAGQDGAFDGDDVIITPGFIGIGERPNEVIFRFSGELPDDLYRITIFGSGANALTNTNNLPFNNGGNFTLDFELDLGAKIIAVVPEPTGRDNLGNLTQAREQIVVYFNNDDLHPTAVTTGDEPVDPTVVDPQFYQLIFTNDTVTNTDDQVFNPFSVSYDPATDAAVLAFDSDGDSDADGDDALANLSTGPGTYRLRVGTNEQLPQTPTMITIGPIDDPGSSFDTAHDLGAFGAESRIIESAIDPVQFPLDFPGVIDEPGHREIVMNDHFAFGADGFDGIGTIAYNFRSDYGFDPDGNLLFNLINPAQKNLARHIFELYSTYLGVEFVETVNQGITVATGDLRALNPLAESGPNGAASITSVDQTTVIPQDGLTIINGGRVWDDTYGGDWFNEAFTGIAYLLRMSYTEELPPRTVTGEDFNLLPDFQSFEPVYPGDHDIVHGRYLYRPEGNDIDLYQISIAQQGMFSAETFAERLDEVSQLDTVISLYQEVGNEYRLISRNDDYYSEDSFVEMDLNPGTYIVGVSASGNRAMDPTVEDSGNYGTSDGDYQLRLNFRPVEQATIVDTTGTALDGDVDGIAGGVYDFWFRTQTLANTLFVDKSAAGGLTADGSLERPYRELDRALAAAEFADDLNDPNDDNIVRVVANGGTDGEITTVDDAQAFLFGFNELEQPLVDGATVKIPRGVGLMIDAGVVFKAQDGAIEVGSSAPGVDRGGGTAQVLGTPDLSVFFTSFNDESIGQDTNPVVEQTPLPGDWGGILFRNDLDRASADRINWEDRGIFLNYVNHADMRFGGGRVEIDSREQIVTPVQMRDARPAVTFNSITFSSDAAMSANPNSFEETNFHAPQFQADAFTSDYDRIGPDVHGNALFNNSTNALFIRIRTPAGDVLQPLTVSGRFNDTDVVHVLAENLVIQGTPGGPTGSLVGAISDFTEDSFNLEARLDARLAIDPGTIVKLDSAHIEVEIGAQFIAEGDAGNRVIFTSLPDDTFGSGGNFDTTSDANASAPDIGDWGGVYFGPVSTGSIDHALFRYGGGITRVESEFAGFNVIEIQQGDVRFTNNIVELSAVGTGGQAPFNRFGLQDNQDATIFIRGSQSVIVDNIIRDNEGPAFNVNVNSLNHFLVTDFGRSTGSVDLIERFEDNQGLLVRGNRLLNNSINGLLVRGATLTTQSVWDDADIVHVLGDEVVVPDFHTYGGLRLESSPNESLVVKLSGSRAGFTAAGRPLDIDDRIGGSVHIIGQPGSPVIITSFADDSVGAGLLPDGTPNNDTGNDGSASVPIAGDWRSILIQEYGNDRNVAVYTEREPSDLIPPGSNSTPDEAEFLGSLAAGENHSDDNLRLGFEVHGFISEPEDVDVFSFQADAGTHVWFDIDRTSQALDTVVELIDSNGTVVARSDNSVDESLDPSLLVGNARRMQALPPYDGEDFFATNPKDAGMLVALPDVAGTNNTYHVRVRSGSDDLSDINGGETSGVYQLQIRLHETDEVAGSNVRYAQIRFATTGIEIQGQPTHSPLLGEASEDGTDNDTFANAQDLGSYLVSERGTISVSGQFLGGDFFDIEDFDPENFLLNDLDLVDFYRFEVIYGDIQRDGQAEYASTVFDVDYADGFSRPNPLLYIFDSQGRLVLTSSTSDERDDRPVGADGDIDDLSRGSLGPLDPYIGSVALPEGVYFAAISAASQVATELSQYFERNASNPLLRLEPINSVVRIVEEHFDVGTSLAVQPVVPVLIDDTSIVPFSLADVPLFVSLDVDRDGAEQSQLVYVDPFSGTLEVDYPEGALGVDVGDIAMLYDGTLGGQLFGFRLDLEDDNGGQEDKAGNYVQIDTASGAYNVVGDDGINTYQLNDNGDPEARPADPGAQGIHFEALTFVSDQLGYAVGNMFGTAFTNPQGVDEFENLIYRFRPDQNGVVETNPGEARIPTDAIELGEIITNVRIIPAAGDAIVAGATTFTIDGVLFEFVDVNGAAPTNPFAIPVPFSTLDTDLNIAFAIQNAININLAPAITATIDFRVDADDPPKVNVLGALNAAEVTGPLVAEGDGGPGGIITGIAASPLGGIFAVSDGGGLYEVFSFDAPLGELADYITTSAADLTDIEFAGLTFGPDSVEEGAFAETLFGISLFGELSAFNTEGVLQPVFVDGQSSVNTGLFNVQGLAFGSLDVNLFHQTGHRDPDAGHGIRQPFDRTRINLTGGSSLYFARDFPGVPIFDYDTPGGAHGVLITNPIDLSEYVSTDRPTLYFNYLALTEDINYSDVPIPMRDSFRVYASDGSGNLGSGQWHLLATNDSFRGGGFRDDEFDDPIFGDLIGTSVQELHDFQASPGSWRQVRVPLDTFAGRSDIRLRFEFASAGSQDFGNPLTTGSELRAAVGSELRDGANFSIDSNTFEFDSGFTAVLPSAPLLEEGETIIVDGRTERTYFEFDNDGVVGNAIFVPGGAAFRDGNTFRVTDGVATELFEFDAGFSIIIPPAGGNPFLGGVLAGDEIVINDNAGSGDVVFQFTKNDLPGTGDINIDISDLSTRGQIADLVVSAIQGAGLGLSPVNLGSGEVLIGGLQFTFDASGAVGVERANSMHVPVAGGDPLSGGIDAGDQFVINDNAGSGDVVFQFTKGGLPGTGDVNIDLNDLSTQDEVANLIVAAVASAGLGLSPLNLGNGKIFLGGPNHTISEIGPLNLGLSDSILVPAAGGDELSGGIADGDRLVVNDHNRSGDVVFEFTKNGSAGTGDFIIEITDASTQDEIADRIVAAINFSGLRLMPVNIGGGNVFVDGRTHTLDTSGSPFVRQRGEPGPQNGGLQIPFAPLGEVSGADMAAIIAQAIDEAGLNLSATAPDFELLIEGNGAALIPGTAPLQAVDHVAVRYSADDDSAHLALKLGQAIADRNIGHTLTATGSLAALPGNILQIPAAGGNPFFGSDPLGGGGFPIFPFPGGDAISAGDQFVINDNTGSGDVVFEFTKNTLPGAGDVNIEITDFSTQHEIAELVVAAIAGSELGLAPINLGGGRVFVGGTPNVVPHVNDHRVNMENALRVTAGVDSKIVIDGQPGIDNFGTVRVPIHEGMTRVDVTNQIAERFASSFAFNQQIVALDGGQLIEGQLVTIDDGVNALTIEFDTGYTMRSPLTGSPGIIDGETFTISNIVTGTHHSVETSRAANLGSSLTILVPGHGGDSTLGGINAGDQFVINNNDGSGDVVFEFTKDGLPGTGDVDIEITDLSTQDEVADLIVAAIQGNAVLGLTPENVGNGRVLVGGLAHTFDLSGSLNLLPGFDLVVPPIGANPLLGGIDAGFQFIINDNVGGGDVIFQFTKGGFPGTGDINVEFNDQSTQDEIANLIVAAIQGAGLGLAPVNDGNGLVSVGATTHTIRTLSSVNLGRGFSIKVPATGADPFLEGVNSGDQFVINDNAGGGDIVFQFTKNGLPSTGDISIEISDLSTQDEIADLIVAAIENSGLGLQTSNEGNGEVVIGGDVHSIQKTGNFELWRGDNILVPAAGGDATLGIAAGRTFVLNDNTGSGDVVFQFTKNNLPATGDVNIDITDASTQDEIADLIVTAIQSTGMGLSPVNLGDGEVFVGGITHTLATPTVTLGSTFTLLVPASGGDPFTDGLTGGQEFVINDNMGSGDVVFQFTKNTLPGTGDINIDINDLSTQDAIADQIVAAIPIAGLGLSPVNLGNGRVVIGGESVTFEFDKNFTNDVTNEIIVIDDTLNIQQLNARIAAAINAAPVSLFADALPSGIVHIGGMADDQIVNRSGMDLSGRPGARNPGATALAFAPDRSFSDVQVAAAMAAIINASDLDLTAAVDGRRVQLFGMFADEVSIGQGQRNVNDVTIPETTTFVVPENGDVLSTAFETGILPSTVATIVADANVDDPLDVDFYAFDLDVGDNITIDIDARVNGSPLDSILRLFDANGFNLAFSDDGAAPGETFTSDSFINFTALTAGRYFVGVSGFSNSTYDPFVAESGVGVNSQGPYQIELRINDPTVNIEFAIPLIVEDAVDTSKEFNDVMRVIGHDVFNPGDLGLADYMWADQFGVFDSNGFPSRPTAYTEDHITSRAAQNNLFEGIFIDDIVIGFAGRGEMVVDAVANSSFPVVNDFDDLPDTENLQGSYQFEIRRGAEYGSPLGNANDIQLILERSFDIDDRLVDAPTIVAPRGADIVNGQTFSLSDGINEVTFEFEEQPPIVESFTGGATVPENGDVIPNAIETGLLPGVGELFFARAGMDDPSDVDLFAMDLGVGDTISVDIDARILGSRVDTILRIFDENGVPLAVSDDNTAPGEVFTFDPFLFYTATANGRYYVGVSSFANFAYDPFVENSGTGFSIGPYQLEITVNGGQVPPGGGGGVIPDDLIIRYFSQNTSVDIAKLIEDAINRDIVRDVFPVEAVSNPFSSRIDLSGPVTVSTGFGTSLAEPNDTIIQALDSGIVPGGNGSFRGRGELLDPLRNRSNIVDLGDFETRTLDVDLIQLELNAGETISIDTDTFLEQGWVSDTVVRVFNDAGAQLAISDDDLAPGESSPVGAVDGTTLESYLEFTAPADGTYYVGVSGGSGFGLGTIFGIFGGVFSFGGNNSYDPNVRDSGSRGSRGAYSIEINRGPARANGIDVIFHEDISDSNNFRDQGQLIIESNFISDSADFGILVTAGGRVESADSPQPHQGPVRALPTLNDERLVTGVTVTNNVVVFNGSGGIFFGGDTNPADGQLAPIPFGRILNNTIFGTASFTEVGIRVENNASPTLLNNIMANLGIGLSVDNSSLSSVLAGLLFQDNLVNSANGQLGDGAIDLDDTAPLFVNPGGRNFYLDAFSEAIDSAISSLEDRPEMIRVREPVGIEPSPILAPELDVFGSLRLDDPEVLTPPGIGETVFIDRGAIDRNDFDGPTVELITPPDGDGNTFASSPTGISEFVIRINDNSTGVADITVNSGQVVIERDGVTLELGTDYTFRYDETNNLIRLTAGPVIWPEGDYRIVINNAADTGIKDLANNPLQANQAVGTVVFTIEVGDGTDFGDAPEPLFSTLLPNGASHQIVQGIFLGFGVDADDNGEPSAEANDDAFDDGVTFDTELIVGQEATITVRASASGRLDAFLGNVQIFASELLASGLNTLTFTVPDSTGAVDGESYARFRFSTAGGLGADGPANDGEVEDYRVDVVTPRWRNPDNPLDVNGNGVVSAQDILLLSSFLFFNGQQPVPIGPGTPPFPVDPPPFYDVNGDNNVSIIDALLVAAAVRGDPATSGAAPSEGDAATTLVQADTDVAPVSTLEDSPATTPLRNAVVNRDFTTSEDTTDDDIVSANLQTSTLAERVTAAVDQVMSGSLLVNDLDFVDGGSSTVKSEDDSYTVDDFFAVFEEIA